MELDSLTAKETASLDRFRSVETHRMIATVVLAIAVVMAAFRFF